MVARLLRCQVTTLGKLFTPMCHLILADGQWCPSAVKVTAGLVESNGSLPPSGWPKATCGLNACTAGSAPGPMLGNEFGRTNLHLSIVILVVHMNRRLCCNKEYNAVCIVCEGGGVSVVIVAVSVGAPCLAVIVILIAILVHRRRPLNNDTLWVYLILVGLQYALICCRFVLKPMEFWDS